MDIRMRQVLVGKEQGALEVQHPRNVKPEETDFLDECFAQLLSDNTSNV